MFASNNVQIKGNNNKHGGCIYVVYADIKTYNIKTVHWLFWCWKEIEIYILQMMK